MCDESADAAEASCGRPLSRICQVENGCVERLRCQFVCDHVDNPLTSLVQKTFKAMVDGADRDKDTLRVVLFCRHPNHQMNQNCSCGQALEIVTRHPGILAAGPDVKDNMVQAALFCY